ncbi:MAG: T9SS type A sorting domain-containing protein [Chitinophagales bacterium]
MKHLLPSWRSFARLLKKQCVVALVVMSFVNTNDCYGQVTIPDPNFAAFLQSNFGSCMSGNQLDTTCNEVTTEKSLDVSSSGIQDLTGIQYFDNLENLFCQDNLLDTLPKLPATLLYLVISNNQFSELPAFPPNLGQLYCTNNLLTEIPQLPSSINVLSCGDNFITSINMSFPGLTYLGVQNNLLTALPVLPSGLKYLVCGGNQITSLPDLPSGLLSVVCNDNLITALPALPTALTELKCSGNQLTSLPALPAGLDYLGCANNLLTALPPLPPSLNTLSVHDNFIISIPSFPGPSFSCDIDLSYNPVSCLPSLPDSLKINICSTSLECIRNFPAGGTIFTCSQPLPAICSGTNECLPYTVSGYVFEDLNANCFFDAGEPPLADRIIKINPGQFFTSTDSNGYYTFFTGNTGAYELSQDNPSPALWELSCNGNLQSIVVVNPSDTFNNRNFPNQIIAYCALPQVDIATAAQRLCFNNNTYAVNYRNKGTLTSFNTFIEIEFDPEIIPLESTLPWTSVNGNTYLFPVGTLAVGAVGSFIITDSVSCDAILTQTACVRANIFPDATCLPVSSTWDLSDLQMTGSCNVTNDTIKFTVRNAGTGDMASGNSVTIYEDDLLMGLVNIDLDSGDSLVIQIPATGKTFRAEALQAPGHPGNSQPRSFVELCGTGPFSLDKIIPVVQDDADDWVDIDCHLITGSFDPNQKSVQPSGVGVDHLVTVNDQLDYIIQFQNTGTDTAFNVLITDTLDIVHLDAKTIQPGASSHPYVFSLRGEGIGTFAFDHIMLPNSIVNVQGSHGFVKYKISQQVLNPPGSVINNFAAIYFDYNQPVLTDSPFVTIAEKSVIFPTSEHPIALQKGYHIKVSPNPFEQGIQFSIKSEWAEKNFAVRIYNLWGQEQFFAGNIHSSTFLLNTSLKEKGIYFYELYNNNELIGTGKLIRQ